MSVERWDEERDGPFSEQALQRKLEERGYDVSRYVYPPGTRFSDHTHPMEKIDAVVSGRFRLVLEGEEAVLEAGDCIVVPEGAVHSAEVVGDQPVVSFDATQD